MQHIGAFTLAFAAIAAAAPGLAPSSHVRRADTNSFQVYAYGTGLGGLEMFTAGGDAYFGDYTQFNDSNAAPVIFTPQDGDDSVWIGAPNTTALATTPEWSNVTFTVPGTSSSDHNVAFFDSNSTTTGRQTSGFVFYGNFILVQNPDDSSLESLWYATASDIDGIYNLKWNQTGDDTDGKILLNLRRTPPSNA
ncbi:hypothetical protein CkaCkLH20_05628 [Colletotrichum karsti]|uniref:Cytochrome p450 protein n=1 Tax=Colletotrichum karsti TaxID=1095194 RepID=A0A9P6LLN9_9PEZI|nr:uncharacterized protein CkaCkLH20_05628 [Colletotrichum karsti]KAF9876782.1 hypothetical protein CkaCkLH20_05628 [Colletotrichum karsti]